MAGIGQGLLGGTDRFLQQIVDKLLEPRPSVVKGSRKAADTMAVLIEDVIKLIDISETPLAEARNVGSHPA